MLLYYSPYQSWLYFLARSIRQLLLNQPDCVLISNRKAYISKLWNPSEYYFGDKAIELP